MSGPSLLIRARDLASHKAWGETCALLEHESNALRESLELTVLLATAWLRTGRPAKACVLLRSALQHPAPQADRTRCHVLNLCGAAHFELGELAEAADAFEHALEMSVGARDDLVAARATNNLALIANVRGNHEDALVLYRTAVPMYQRIGKGVGVAESLHNMAIAYRNLDRLDEADEHEVRAMDMAREHDDDRLVAIALVGRAEVALRRGDFHMAEATALHAAERFAEVADPARRADALRLSAVARATHGRPGAAAPLLDEAVDEARSCGATLIEAECLQARAELCVTLGETARARADATAAIELFERVGATPQRDSLQRWRAGLTP